MKSSNLVKNSVAVHKDAEEQVDEALISPPVPYPVFSVHDPKWAKQPFGDSPHPIESRGSVLCCITSYLSYKGQTLDSLPVTPLSVQDWLLYHEGFTDENEIDWYALRPFAIEFRGFITGRQTIMRVLQQRKGFVIARVVNLFQGFHFVLATGWDDKGLLVIDPVYEDTKRYDWVLVQNAAVFEQVV